jgi:uncharacterized membrane protein
VNTVTIVAWVLRVVTAIIFVGMGINHFRPRSASGMARMIPPFLRWEGALKPVNLVYFTGVCEVLGGVGILLPWTRVAAAIALAVFLILVFPANAYAAKHRDRFGRVAIPFWPRLAAQIVLIAVVLLAGLLG